MDNLSPYELAQQRIEQRQRRQTYTQAWLVLAITCFLLTSVAGKCALPLLIISVCFAVYNGIEWYTSRHWTPPPALVKREMAWLFGEGWQNGTGVYEFSLALERIHKRRRMQRQFTLHLGFFLLANIFILGLFVYTPGPVVVLIVPAVWLAMLAHHFVSALPTQRRLMQREQRAGEAIQREIEKMQSTKLKNEDKLKNDAYYTVGDDGELVEVDRAVIEDSNPVNDNKENIEPPEETARSSNDESIEDSLS